MNLEDRLKDAFDGVKAPEDARAQALSYIESIREIEENAEDAPTLRDVAREQPRKTRHQSRRPRRWWGAITAAAACAALLAVGLFGVDVYLTPTAYVGIDVNPSIELSINRFDRVTEASALNQDGEELLDSCGDLLNKSYDDALRTIFGSDGFRGYEEGDSFVSVDVVSGDDAQAQKLEAQSQLRLGDLACDTQCSISDDATRNAARKAGMGVGRYRMARELMEIDGSYSFEKCAFMSMRELRDAYEAACRADDEERASGAGVSHRGSGQRARIRQHATASN